MTLSVNYDDIYKWSFNFCSEFAVVHLIRILTILSALVSYGDHVVFSYNFGLRCNGVSVYC